VELREREVHEVLKEMRKRIREALEKAEGEMEERKKGIVGERRIVKKKRLVRRALTEWRKERGEIADYKREKKEYKELCGIKRKEENKRWEEEAEESKTEEQVGG